MFDPKSALEAPFELTVEKESGSATIRLRGELDLAAEAEFDRALEGLDEGTEELLLDLSGLTFIDSTGIRILIQTVRSCEEKGRAITFVPATGAVHELLKATGVAAQLRPADGSAG